ncbi:tRNA (adenosine(37)-N6)-threonylcarbamoyltransferase complex ATPase subunit type 1 TsaE [Aerococcus kribbianus]|uniref:tRNA threonylcarbamoyladenosine biosynthesis protein TsaE n=1 Tax=Aerococcus kribbianus TaxID=2999064 RepID=A0A9X3JEX7_9LACT|nr:MULTISPECIES: tRNA (adenosine(37)-N6)-threonylcarbamoyltransferase complex ATPase subunit type 1 TsaE [unclassified Aerococcus]MCZ0717078.1 tRNA (adenosine(37)-N6)-threonylcarbamoyltransferase complex ATPase subunit type 1 TsaE [Aerococcus sp. YH-aer221]MCZ0725366.1 tRNA (adenosine(37)-N6)-threonylcarbamoyltransferase complex ATPase subunit type 1 TsaE [Aerococcus sp. YH-aer222]
MEFKVLWQDEESTQGFAQLLAACVQAGDIICLEGGLGAGKTTFTRYFAQALGIKRPIKSPTYTIVREYTEGPLAFYHMDAYRLEETGADDLALIEYLSRPGVSVIEWPQFIAEDLPDDYLWLSISKTTSTSREVTIKAFGLRGEELLAAVKERY